jgi:hypothetical protein
MSGIWNPSSSKYHTELSTAWREHARKIKAGKTTGDIDWEATRKQQEEIKKRKRRKSNTLVTSTGAVGNFGTVSMLG